MQKPSALVHSRRLLVALLFSSMASQAMEVVAVSGRADLSPSGESEWSPLRLGPLSEANLNLRIQPLGMAILTQGSNNRIEFRGPAEARMLRIPGLDGGRQDLVFHGMQGFLRLDLDSTAFRDVRIRCGPWQVEGNMVTLRLVCSEEKGWLLVQMMKGQASIARSGEYGINLNAGKAWKTDLEGETPYAAFLTPQGADSLFAPWKAPPPDAKNPRLPVALFWEGSPIAPPHVPWDIRGFLQASTQGLPGISTDSSAQTEWSVHARIAQFSVSSDEIQWSLDVRIEFQLLRVGSPIENKTLLFERQWTRPNTSPNRLPLLSLLPLDSSNPKIASSLFGLMQSDLREYLIKEVMNPFARSGM